jgi:hypothetical protein
LAWIAFGCRGSTVQPSGLARTRAAACESDIQTLSRQLDQRSGFNARRTAAKLAAKHAAARWETASIFAKQFAKAMDPGVKALVKHTVG